MTRGCNPWILGFVLLSGATAGRAAPILTAGPGEFNSSQQCGACHRDIHAAWSRSAHALAVEDPLFLDALRELDAEGGDVRFCLGCHAPTVDATRDVALEKKVTWEGVTCDYCHSIASLGAAPAAKPKLQVGGTKFGPIADAESSAHETAHRPFFTGSEVCAACHEYATPAGVPVLTTYSEWKASPQARAGKTCQTCHMSEVKADVVDPKVARAGNATVNLHSMPGGHSIEQLNRAVLVKADVSRRAGTLRVDLELANRGAGHAVPTGSSARQIVLEVRVDSNRGQRLEQSRVYHRIVTDAAGTQLHRDRDLLLRAARVESDTRLAAGEVRPERFEFDVDPGATANVKVRLVYQSTPPPGGQPSIFQVFYTQSWTLPPG